MWLPDRHGFTLFLLLSVDLPDPGEHGRTERHKSKHIKLKDYIQIQKYFKLWSVWSAAGYLGTAVATVLSLTEAPSSSGGDGSGNRCEHRQVKIWKHAL